jgi:hypothetical protein
MITPSRAMTGVVAAGGPAVAGRQWPVLHGMAYTYRLVGMCGHSTGPREAQ